MSTTKFVKFFKEKTDEFKEKKKEFKEKLKVNKVNIGEFFKLGEQVAISVSKEAQIEGKQVTISTPVDAENVWVSPEVEQQITKTTIQGFSQAIDKQIIEKSDNKLVIKLEARAKEAVDVHIPKLVETAIAKEIEKQIAELAKLAKKCESNKELKEYLQHPVKHLIVLVKLAKTNTSFCKLFKDIYVKLPADFDAIGKLTLIANAIGGQVGASFCKSLCTKMENILLLAKPIKSIISVCSSLVSPPILSFGFSILGGALTGIYNTVFEVEPQESLKSIKKQESKKDKISGLLHTLCGDFKEILKVEQENVNCIRDTIVKGSQFLMKDKKCGKYTGIILDVVSKPVKVVLSQAIRGFAAVLAVKSCFYKYTGKILKAAATSVTQIALDFIAHEGREQLSEHKKYISSLSV